MADGGTPLAIQACYHIMRRYRDSADFAYLMAGTESLSLVQQAIALHGGRALPTFHERMADQQKVRHDGQPRVKELEKRVEELEQQLHPAGDPIRDEIESRSEAARTLDRVEALRRDADLRGVTITPDQLAAAIAGRYVFTA